MTKKTNDLDKSSKTKIESKEIQKKSTNTKIPASVKAIIKSAEKNIKKLEKNSKKVSTTSSKSEKSKTKTSKTKKTTKTEPISIIENYELPYRYNETIVKILYQTPNTLFVYWDISDKDRKKYI